MSMVYQVSVTLILYVSTDSIWIFLQIEFYI